MAADRRADAPQQRGALAQLFLDHPRDIGETYAEHAGHALVIGARMVGAGLACLVHALVPGLFVRTASDTVDGIVARMASRSEAARGPLARGLGADTPGSPAGWARTRPGAEPERTPRPAATARRTSP